MDRVTALVAGAMGDVERTLFSALESRVPLINELVTDMIKSGGKRIRPLFHMLVASMCGYRGEDARTIGVILEYIHTASLLHDDVIDNAMQRRGKPSANAVYDNMIPVLAGDYLYTNAFDKIINLGEKKLCYVLTKAVSSMSEGEIFQMLKMGDLNITMDDYKYIIYGKTSALFTAACECGAILGGGGEESIKLMRDYGLNVGYAFQMRDDVLDYFGSKEVTGKMPGTDLEEKKSTLPVILLYAKLDNASKKAFSALFLSDMQTEEKLDKILRLMNSHNIHEESASVVKSYVDAAMENLNSFEDSEYRQALSLMTEQLNYRAF